MSSGTSSLKVKMIVMMKMLESISLTYWRNSQKQVKNSQQELRLIFTQRLSYVLD
jgi:hypothetical protein